jgi:transcriptional regulator with XRE-family HTH domain
MSFRLYSGSVVFPDKLVREARQKAGLTQAELGKRLGMTQSAIAKLERPGANPTVETLDRVLRAAHQNLRISSSPYPENVDHTLISSQRRRLTPAERIQEAGRFHAFAQEIAGKAGRVEPG